MSNVIKFPRATKQPSAEPAEAAPVAAPTAPKAAGRGLPAGLVRFVWVATILVWPILKWVLSFDVVWQFLRMVYHWNTPGVHAGWTFVLHFAVLTALTYYVSVYKPKGL